jgi:hypothetical protein
MCCATRQPELQGSGGPDLAPVLLGGFHADLPAAMLLLRTDTSPAQCLLHSLHPLFPPCKLD